MLQNGYVDQAGYEAILSGALGVHPTFFYESAWNLVGLIVVYWMGKRRRFDGECFLFYFFWYGLGRAWIEGLRTDTLKLFGWELFGQPIRVSQLLSVALAAAALGVLIVNKRRRRGRETLFVNRKAAMEAAEPIQEQEDTAK